MSVRHACVAVAVVLGAATSTAAADMASGAFKADKHDTITPKYATAYLVRDTHDPRQTMTEIILTDVAIDAAEIRAALNPHMVAINVDPLNDRNYLVLWVAADGRVTMNATYSKTMTQYVNGTDGDLGVTWTTRTASRLEGRLRSAKPIKLKDGVSYTVDLQFGADVPAAPVGQTLAADGGAPGKALVTLLSAVERNNWTAIKAVLSPNALERHNHDYNTPAENASGFADLIKAWIPTTKMKILGGTQYGDVAILDVQGEQFPGMDMLSLSLVKMIRRNAVWTFDEAVRAGQLP